MEHTRRQRSFNLQTTSLSNWSERLVFGYVAEANKVTLVKHQHEKHGPDLTGDCLRVTAGNWFNKTDEPQITANIHLQENIHNYTLEI